MTFVTLKAKERFILMQKIIGNGAMRVVADIAVFFDWRMLKHKGPLMASMAVETEVPSQFVSLQFAMRVVTVAAGHFAFLDRMV